MCYMDKKKMCDTKVSPVRPDTSSSYLRKIKKPLIERKRRERINNCLSQLKSILLDNIKQNGGTQVSKLDKADILEMTVSHLRQIHHQQLSAAMATSSSVVTQFREGYAECAAETVRYMEASRAYPADMVMRVHSNLANKVGVGFSREYHTQARLALTGTTTGSEFSSMSRECTPVKVKVESTISPCKSLSPDSGFDSAFSPLLMTVPGAHFKHQKTPETTKNTSYSSASDSSILETSTEPCSSSDLSNVTLDNSAEQHAETNECKTSQSSVLALPSRLPVVVGDSPPQKQVWRPF